MKPGLLYKMLFPILCAAGLLFAPPAMAAAQAPDAFDINVDGQITFAEVMKKLETSARKTFDAMDRNNDGVLSSKDFDDMRQGMEKLEDWLHDLLKPFVPANQPESGRLEL